MEYNHPNFVLQAAPPLSQRILNGLRKVFAGDPALMIQLFATLIVFAASFVLHLNFVQWILVSVVTLLFLVAGIFRTAALQQIRYEKNLTPFQVSRIRITGNLIVLLTGGITLMTYLLVFVPRITQML